MLNNNKKANLKRVIGIRRRLEQGVLGAGQVIWVDTQGIPTGEETFNVADLFSGAGGLTLGFVQAGYLPLFGVECDPVASATFRYNFPKTAHYESRVEDVDLDIVEELMAGRKLHVLLAGFPCPGFSVAGFRRPHDKRNQLYRWIIPFVARLRPWFIVLENVPGFVTLDKGRFVEKLFKDFMEVGYLMSVQVLEAAEYGVPQLRPRTIIIGNKFGLPNPYPRPFLTEDKYISIEAAIRDFKDIPAKPELNHEWTKHSTKMEERIAKVPPGGSLYTSYVDAWKRQYPGKPSMTVKENHGGTHIHPELNRVLSARELARLQSFPDWFIFEGTMKRVYFQVGNAVPPTLARHIALALLPSLRRLLEGSLVPQQDESTSAITNAHADWLVKASRESEPPSALRLL